jgi:TPR repeat protein
MNRVHSITNFRCLLVLALVSSVTCFGQAEVRTDQVKFEARDRPAAYLACPLLQHLNEWWLSDFNKSQKPSPAELEKCEAAAAAGDARAQYAMLEYHLSQVELPQARAEAYRWARAAADNGFPAAFSALAVMQLFIGPEDRRDEKLGLENLRKAVDAGYAPALNLLAQLYRRGEKVAADPEEALRLLVKSAELGWASSAGQLGIMYFKGQGVTEDLAAAAKWYRRAAELGDPHSQAAFAGIAFVGAGMPSSTQQALLWYKKAADQGHAEAQYMLAGMHRYGYGVPKNIREAVRLYRLAADQGYLKAIINLGVAYEFGQGVVRDRREALRLYRIAADRGLDAAQTNLADLYRKGYGVERDNAAAIYWYRKAVDQKSATGQFELARMLELGRGISRNLAEAQRLYALAALQEDERAIEALRRLRIERADWPRLAERKSDREICDFNPENGVQPLDRIAACDRVIASGALEDSALALSVRGVLYRDKREYKAAIRDLSEVIRLRSTAKNGDDRLLRIALTERANAYVGENRRDLAIQDHDELLEMNPDQHQILNERCYSLAILGRLEAALADCNRALEIEPKNPYYLDSRGYTYLHLANLPEALRDFDASLELLPDEAITLFGRAVVKGKMGDRRGAQADLAKARSIQPDVDDHAAQVFMMPP